MAVALRFGILLNLLLATAPVLACSVCGYATEASRSAFILTTALLTFVPLLFIGAVVYYLKKKTNSSHPGSG